MILFNTTYSVLFESEAGWLQWVREHHLPALRRLPAVTECRLLKLLTEIDNGGTTYTVQVGFGSPEAGEHFLTTENEKLQAKMYEAFPGQFVSFQSLLREL